MIIKDECQLPCSVSEAWQALNDPEMLRRSIGGCESVERTGDNRFECLVTAKYGPVKIRFKVIIDISNINAPYSYTLTGEGKGGIAGFGKGRADVELSEQDDMTRLCYQAEFSVGGKLAQIGSRLIASTTRKLARDFFARFAARLTEQLPPPS